MRKNNKTQNWNNLLHPFRRYYGFIYKINTIFTVRWIFCLALNSHEANVK